MSLQLRRWFLSSVKRGILRSLSIAFVICVAVIFELVFSTFFQQHSYTYQISHSHINTNVCHTVRWFFALFLAIFLCSIDKFHNCLCIVKKTARSAVEICKRIVQSILLFPTSVRCISKRYEEIERKSSHNVTTQMLNVKEKGSNIFRCFFLYTNRTQASNYDYLNLNHFAYLSNMCIMHRTSTVFNPIVSTRNTLVYFLKRFVLVKLSFFCLVYLYLNSSTQP